MLASLASLGVPACGSASHGQVDGARALARVAMQVDAGPRIPGSPGHATVRDWIASELARLGGTVERQRFIDSTLAVPLPLENVIGRFGPYPAPGGRLIVLAAHYDTRPWCDQDPDTSRHREPVAGAVIRFVNRPLTGLVTADRLLVIQRAEQGERRSRAGILIPATASVGRRLVWADVVAVGPTVRNIETNDRVLFSPEDAFEVDLRGDDYQIIRERDVHAVASERAEGQTGLYL